jgi:hypothetical protein
METRTEGAPSKAEASQLIGKYLGSHQDSQIDLARISAFANLPEHVVAQDLAAIRAYATPRRQFVDAGGILSATIAFSIILFGLFVHLGASHHHRIRTTIARIR